MIDKIVQVKTLRIELQCKKELMKLEKKYRNLIAEADSKARDAIVEKEQALHREDIAVQEKKIVIAENQCLLFDRRMLLKKINKIKKSIE